MPGTTAAPRRSTISVAAPASSRISSSDPTAAMRPAATASAVAAGRSASSVRTRPPTRTRSAVLIPRGYGPGASRRGLVRMRPATTARILVVMDDPDRARRLDEENRERFAIRKEEGRMAAEERELEEELEDLGEDLEEAEDKLDRELREEHWGHEPEHPPAWHDGPGPPPGRRHGRRVPPHRNP